MNAHDSQLRQGNHVVASDGAKVGTVKAVREDHLVVEHGLLAKHDLYIPIDAFERTADGTVTLHVPGGEVESQGWLFPPASSHERLIPAPPEVPETTMIQAAGYSAGELSAPEAQGFARDADADDEVLANSAIDPRADEAVDEEQ